MKFAYFPGCKIAFHLPAYGMTFEMVMKKLGVELVQLPFHCCGYPARGEHFESAIFASIKNFALAQKKGLDIITPCKCCFGQFKHAANWYENHPELQKKTKDRLAREHLSWDGTTQVHHLVSFLHNTIGLPRLETKIVTPLPGKKVVVQYGCHALRPFSITGFDHPHAPTIFENIIRTTGMQPVEWSQRTECCGNPSLRGNRKLALKILEHKYASAARAKAAYICTACTHCQMQYEAVLQEPSIETHGIQVVLLTTLLAAAMGEPGLFSE